MSKVKNIVVLIDDLNNPNASIETVSDFINAQENVHVHFVAVISSLDEIKNTLKLTSSKVEKILSKHLNNSINESLAAKQYQGQFSVSLKVGVSFIEVIREVMLYEAQLLIVPVFNPPTDPYDSNTMHMIRKCPCTVWVMRHSELVKRPRVLVAVDNDINNSVIRSNNRKAIEMAKWLQASTRCSFSLIHTWALRNEAVLRQESFLEAAQAQINDMISREKKFHDAWFKAFCGKIKNLNVSNCYFKKGDPEEVIPAMVAKSRFDIVIMGSVSTLSIPGLIIGNHAEAILQRLRCSVIVVKPEGFVTPVQPD